MSTVLFTNGQLRKTLSCVRSLGKRGINVIVSDKTLFTPSGFSKYCSKKLVYPCPLRKRDAFLEWVEETVQRFGCSMVFPMDDDTMEAVIYNRERFGSSVLLPVPPAESYKAASDKWLSVRLAMDAGLQCPKTVLPCSIEELKDYMHELEFPVVIKPRKSSGSRGIKIARNMDELAAMYRAVDSEYPKPILQEYIPTGDRYDVCLLFGRDGKPKASFVQKEIRHYPLEMGPSTVQQSVEMTDLVEKAAGIFEKTPWFGVVELEFMHDKRDGKLKFMEINARFWNSLEMAVYAGVDFPWLLYQCTLGNEVAISTGYRTGVYCRWLLPGDILHFLQSRERFNMYPPFLGGKGIELHDDILSYDDPLPVVGFAAACLRYIADKEMWKLMFFR